MDVTAACIHMIACMHLQEGLKSEMDSSSFRNRSHPAAAVAVLFMRKCLVKGPSASRPSCWLHPVITLLHCLYLHCRYHTQGVCQASVAPFCSASSRHHVREEVHQSPFRRPQAPALQRSVQQHLRIAQFQLSYNHNFTELIDDPLSSSHSSTTTRCQ